MGEPAGGATYALPAGFLFLRPLDLRRHNKWPG